MEPSFRLNFGVHNQNMVLNTTVINIIQQLYTVKYTKITNSKIYSHIDYSTKAMYSIIYQRIYHFLQFIHLRENMIAMVL